mmetsp:Transcript_32946/g.98097  ORF Transcript_32946/g.98097 Transcript_32946/m.98097 type:complete len:424 (-) Transcript_32946:109-1380(-)
MMNAVSRACPRPNGNVIFVPVLLATIAWCFSIAATAQCSFVKRKIGSSLPISSADDLLLNAEQGIGFWGWETAGKCFSYTINGKKPEFDIMFKLSKALTGVSDIVGGFAMTALWTSTCLPVTPQRFRQYGCLIFVAMASEALTFLIMTSSVCSGGFFSYAIEDTEKASKAPVASCGIANGAIWAAMAALFWAFSACACMKMPSPKEEDDTLVAASDGGARSTGDSTMEGADMGGMAAAGVAAGGMGAGLSTMASEPDLGMGMSTMNMGMGAAQGEPNKFGGLGVVGEGDEGEEYGEEYEEQGGYENQDGYNDNQGDYNNAQGEYNGNQDGYNDNQGSYENQGDYDQGGDGYQGGQDYQADDYQGYENQGGYDDQGQGAEDYQGGQEYQEGQDYQADDYQGSDEYAQGEGNNYQEQGDDKGYTN